MLLELEKELAFELVEVDIEQDDALLRRYQWTIPVLLLEGKEIAAAPITRRYLRRALR